MSSVREVAAAVRSKERSAREVTEAALAAVAGRDGELHAFLEVLGDEALAEADAVDAAIARGEDPGPLAGVPVALKDNLCTRGIADHLCLEDPRRLAAALRRHGGGALARRRGDRTGQDQHGRVCHGQLDGELRLRATATRTASSGCREAAAAVRGRGGRRFRPARARVRHGGIDPPTGRAVRCRGHEAHIRPRLALWAGGVCQLPRPDRALRRQRRRRRPSVRCAGAATTPRHDLAAPRGPTDARCPGGRSERRACRRVPRPH